MQLQEKKFNDMVVNATIEFDAMKFDTDFFDASNHSIFRINPRIEQTFDRLKLTAGANVAIEINDLTNYHLYPHARIDYTLVSGNDECLRAVNRRFRTQYFQKFL
jgi:hypothetical protein